MPAERREEVARRAYALWEAEGKPEGRQLEHWLQAEREVESVPRPEAGPPEVLRDRARGESPRRVAAPGKKRASS